MGELQKVHAVLLSLLFVLVGYAKKDEPRQTADTRREQAQQTAPDNTGVNVRDRNPESLTAGDQSESEADRTLTQQVRQVIVADDSLSTYGKNVKIITVDGVVTLRGPVKSQQEKVNIGSKAQQIAGVKRVDNQLEIVTN
jgi:osmotically-inducible protein OsmY